MRIGVYGGSFDPPHSAHTEATRLLLEQGHIERALVVPVFEHAFAKSLTPHEHRVAMCRLAFAEQPRVEVSELERELPRPSYTVQLLETLHAADPTAELHLIVGADVLTDLPRWRRVERVKELARLLVLGRVGYPHADAPAPTLPALSSSEIRARLREGGTLRGVVGLCPAVVDYIERHGLYR